MNLFKYVAIDKNHATVDGVLEGTDKQVVAERLIMQGLRPLTIKPYEKTKISSKSFLAGFRQHKLTRVDIDFFTSQISLLLNAGLSLDVALRIMKQHSHKPAFREFTGQIEQKLKEGKSFSQALSDFSHFTPTYINIVRAGEEGGILPAMLVKISEYQATFQELKQYIISAAIYPIFLLFVGITAIIILLTTILPRFELLFEGMGQQLPFQVRIMMDTARIVENHPLLILIMLTLPPIALWYYLQSRQGKASYDRLSLKIPVLSGFIQGLETTRVFRTLEVLVSNGVHLATALKISSGVASNIKYRQLLNKATQELKEGRQIGPKLKGEGLFPDLAVDLLSIGEDSGRVGQVCGQVADHYEQELRVKIKRIISLVEPVFILFIAIITGYIVMSMLSVILSINDIAN